jgi:hypothetical protein
MNENQHNAVRLAAILEEDDAPIPPNTNGKANGHAEMPCLFCGKNPRRMDSSDYCQSCWNEKEHTGVKPKPKRELSSPRELCTKCKQNPRRTDMQFCDKCFKRFTPEAKLRYKRAARPQCKTCCENPIADPENGGTECHECIRHAPTRTVKQASLEFPEESMYGWLGDYARKLGCPLSAAYPAVLAVAAGYGVPDDRRVRATLYVTLLGKTRAGKSVTKDRAVDSWTPPTEAIKKDGYPGSEIGLIQMLGGKKVKGDEHDFETKSYLLVQDEMRMMFGKIAIQNSALPYALNQMFYKDVFETATKQGHWVCDARLSVLGCLTCANPDEFADIYGVDTATGLYGRTIFGIVSNDWDFDWGTWEPPNDAGEMPGVWRRSKTCKVTAEAFRMADEWAKDKPERAGLKELALRVALITSSLNHNTEVTEEAMRKALMFMEWQERIRSKYQPSEMNTPSGKCQQAIVRALEHYEDWVSWRDLCRTHSLYGSKAWDAKILNSMKRAMIFEGMIEEEHHSGVSGRDTNEKTGRVRLVR